MTLSAVAAVVALLLALAPGGRSVAGAASTAGPVPAADAVRVVRGDHVLVYDKRRSYVAAELAERWPSVVCDVLPADQIESAGVLHDVTVDVHWPWWN